MVGVICKREILLHPVLTIQCFGWTVFLRAVFAGPKQTFLSLLNDSRHFERPLQPVPEIIASCIDLERHAMKIYDLLSRRYARDASANEFFLRLARQEQDHAELLELCRAAAGRRGRREACFDGWRETVGETEKRLREAEANLDEIGSLAGALRLVLEIESSQINRLFARIVAATDPRLACKLRAFRNAVHDHLGYLCECVPRLEPGLSDACRALWAAVPKTRLANSDLG
jgi:rubrerythrin